MEKPKAERVLSLDISTKTGWAFFLSEANCVLQDYGIVKQIPCPDSAYPESFVEWANLCYSKILELIDRFKPDVLIIEETSGNSKSSHSQKILEFIHFLLANHIKGARIKSVYIMSGQWGSETGCAMTKEEKLRNKETREYKKKNNSNLAYDKQGKRVGIVTRKHVYIRRANEVFGNNLREPLKRKDEDMAAALLLGYTYHIRKLKRGNHERQ